MAATSPEQVPSPQGRGGCSHSSAGTRCLGTSPGHTAASVGGGLVWRVGAELFRSSLPAPIPSCTLRVPSSTARFVHQKRLQPCNPKPRFPYGSHCPFSLLWPLKCSCPPSLNVSFALGPRQSLLFQKLGKGGKPKAQGLTANAVPTPVYQK